MGRYAAPGKFKCTIVYGCYLISLLIIKKKKIEKEQKHKAGALKIWAANCFNYNFIGALKHIYIGSAISRKAIYYAFTKRELRMGPEDR